jgi:hypothetical protein
MNDRERGQMSRRKATPRPATLDVHEVGRLYRMHPINVYKNAKAGLLPVAPLRVGNRLRWPTEAVLASLGLDELPAGTLDDEHAVSPAFPRRRPKASA